MFLEGQKHLIQAGRFVFLLVFLLSIYQVQALPARVARLAILDATVLVGLVVQGESMLLVDLLLSLKLLTATVLRAGLAVVLETRAQQGALAQHLSHFVFLSPGELAELEVQEGLLVLLAIMVLLEIMGFRTVSEILGLAETLEVETGVMVMLLIVLEKSLLVTDTGEPEAVARD